jgi:hypothetical protein
MPYLDLPKDHRHFKALQRIGATGLLKGEGRNVGWANQTWFRAGDPLLVEELYVEEFYRGPIDLTGKEVSVGQLLGILRGLGAPIPASSPETWWNGLGLENYDQSRTVTRLETAVVVDATVDLFSMFHVDYEGNLKR